MLKRRQVGAEGQIWVEYVSSVQTEMSDYLRYIFGTSSVHLRYIFGIDVAAMKQRRRGFDVQMV